MFRSKLKAFSVHLLISMIVATISLYIVYYVWYPSPLHIATGVNKIFLLLICIDVILGPLLTFIVYNPSKKTLKFDITVVLLLQLIAFIYGFYQVYSGRPVWIVYNVDRFDLIKSNEIDYRLIDKAKNVYKSGSYFGPRYVAAVIPKENIRRKNQILFDEIGYGIAPSQRPELYDSIKKIEDVMNTRIRPLNDLYSYNAAIRVDEVKSIYSQVDGFLPLKANSKDMVVLINKHDDKASVDVEQQIIDIVDLRPW